MIHDMCRKFADEELAPHAGKWDKEHTFPEAAVKHLVSAEPKSTPKRPFICGDPFFWDLLFYSFSSLTLTRSNIISFALHLNTALYCVVFWCRLNWA
jgi:hypothetical protein